MTNGPACPHPIPVNEVHQQRPDRLDALARCRQIGTTKMPNVERISDITVDSGPIAR